MSQSHEQLPATPTTDSAICLDTPTPARPNTASADYPVALPDGALAAEAILARDPLADFYYEALVGDPTSNLRDALFTCYMHNYAGFNAMLSVVHDATLAERRCEPEPERAACLDALVPGFAAGKQALRLEPTSFELDILLGQLDPGTAPLTASFVTEVYEGAAECLSRRLLEHAEDSGDESQLSRAFHLMSLLGVEASPAQESCPQQDSGGWFAQFGAFDKKYSVMNRIGGLMQFGGGLADIRLGAFMALAPPSPPMARLAGAGLAAHGVDDAQAGLRTFFTGKPTKTLTETLATKAAEVAGLSEANAGRVGMGVDFAAGLLNPGNVGKFAMREGAERLGREGAEHLDDGARAGAKLGDEAAEGADEAVDAQRASREVGEASGERAAKDASGTTEEVARREVAEESAQAGLRAERIAPSRQPDPTAIPGGRRTKLNPNDKDPTNIRALTRENDSADALARSGYNIEQNPSVSGPKNPDYRIEGRIFDNYAPTTKSPRNIWDTVVEKVTEEQASRIVLNLDDSAVSLDALRSQFAAWPVDGLQEILVVRGGQVIPFFP